mmetsp:Transcript_20524/g.66633  ORF Transcript_20524/g.66633 Transcript_20524/m.66633 type:complete len:365 (-) Transcript_20524:105-1199(-)|eukprot:CAMPEP_0170133596 /NCGR_PEP_ID=MMETSP0033_2-20121228/1411_1 /TAXON_ID=195969 /ORGANISM="Dolichomastix tenuilepis, Strain CCMP3274" /LENGTH=364 /DNA_ID=CAMNT_0010369099 /DNA_START=10 /DNA_END=1104 /DNA_ORIENTATION=+
MATANANPLAQLGDLIQAKIAALEADVKAQLEAVKARRKQAEEAALAKKTLKKGGKPAAAPAPTAAAKKAGLPVGKLLVGGAVAGVALLAVKALGGRREAEEAPKAKARDLDSAQATPFQTPSKDELARMKAEKKEADEAALRETARKLDALPEMQEAAAAKAAEEAAESPAPAPAPSTSSKLDAFKKAGQVVKKSNQLASETRAGTLKVTVHHVKLAERDMARFGKAGYVYVNLVLPLDTQRRKTAKGKLDPETGIVDFEDNSFEFMVPVNHRLGELQVKLKADDAVGTRPVVAKCGIFLKAIMYHIPFEATFNLFSKDKSASGSSLMISADFVASNDERQKLIDQEAAEEAANKEKNLVSSE